ncbi:MAG: hypothetical protein ACLFPQ_05625 [Candidatus Woesearchaeota archaeon]
MKANEIFPEDGIEALESIDARLEEIENIKYPSKRVCAYSELYSFINEKYKAYSSVKINFDLRNKSLEYSNNVLQEVKDRGILLSRLREYMKDIKYHHIPESRKKDRSYSIGIQRIIADLEADSQISRWESDNDSNCC